MSGWIKLHRQIQDDALWLSEPFTKSQAWIDLILGANHKSNFIDVRGFMIKIERGQVGWSEMTMAKRWMWSRGKVKRYLDFLVEIERITVQRAGQYKNVISICNYCKYQDDGTTNDTANSTTNEPRTNHEQDHERYTNKNDKNGKNDKKKENTPAPPSVNGKYKWQNHEIPPWMPRAAWMVWIEQRTKLKAVNSERAINGLINKLNDCREIGYDTEEVIDIAIQRGWKSIEVDWVANAKLKKKQTIKPTVMYDEHGREIQI